MPRSSKKIFSEPIPREALLHVVRHELPKLELKSRDENLDIRLRRMYAKLGNDGFLKVTYAKKIRDKSGKEYGREYSTLPLSFQNLNKSIRNALMLHYIETSGNRCVDIDVVNCHPEMFLQILENHNVPSDFNIIAKYVHERKTILNEVQEAYKCDRDTAKMLLLSLINFGTVEGWAVKNNVVGFKSRQAKASGVTAFLEEYNEQFRSCVSDLMSSMPELVEISKQSLQNESEPFGSIDLQKRFVHILLTDAENQVLQAAMEYITKKHKSASIISKMYDGCIVQCEDDIDCGKLRCHVMERTDFLMKFEVKPFVSSIRIPTDLPTADENIAECGDLTEEDKLVAEAILMPTNYNVAKVFHHCFPESYAFTDSASKWFCFKSPRWKCVLGNTAMIVRAIDTVIVPKMHDLINRLDLGEVTIPALMQVSVGNLRHSVNKTLGSIGFKNDVASQLQSFYQVEDPFLWISSLDSNPDILGLSDCVYDIEARVFRDGRPEDMITLSCGHRREDVEFFDETIANHIYDAVTDMFDDEDKFKYVWSRLSSCISGRRPCDAFDILTGKGRNGKGVVKAVMSSAFGASDTGYYYEPDALVFTSQRQNASGPCPELAKFKGKRCCMSSEGNTGDTLQLALLKKLTGGDSIQARDLNKSFIDIVPTFNLFLLFNVIPSVDDTSNATKRRLRIIDFPFEYFENPDPEDKRQKQMQESLRDTFASKAYGATALGIMIKWFNEHGHHAKPPKCIADASSNFMMINDPLSEFMLTHFTRGDSKDFVLVKDVMTELRNDATYRSQLGIRKNAELIQILRNKGFDVPYTKKHGYDFVKGLKVKSMVDDDGCE